MYKRIIVPLDGSSQAEAAIPLAAHLAHASTGTVILLQVVPEDESSYIASTSLPNERGIDLQRATEYLTRIAQRADLRDIPTSILVLKGPIAQTILDTACTQAADLLLLCRRRPSGIASWVLGSVVDHLVRHSTIPLLLLHEHRLLSFGQMRDPSFPLRALVPLDGSLLAEAAVVPAVYLIVALGHPGRGALHLVRVVPNSARWRREAHYLSHIAKKLREGVVAEFTGRVTWAVVAHFDVAEALITEAEIGEDAEAITTISVARDLGDVSTIRQDNAPDTGRAFPRCDLIALTTHGRGGFQHWVLGSVTERILHTSDLPLLIVPAPKGVSEQEMIATEDQWYTRPLRKRGDPPSKQTSGTAIGDGG